MLPLFEPKGRVLLVDGHHLAYRTFFALKGLTTSRGEPVQAVYGFAKSLLKALKEDGEVAIVVFDAKAPSFRHEAYEAYKAGRAPTPEDFPRQLALIKELVDLLGLVRLEVPGFEADDVLATLAKEAEREGYEVRILSADRDLYQLLNNFVAFTDFYGRERKAVFQAGTLYLDGRACELCVRVDDAGKHAALAGLSKTYLAYCDCTRKGTAEKMTIAAAFTGGDSDHLMVGRNGVFYDRKGQDWDATITKIVEQPISIRQAIWAPYKRIARMIGEQIEKMASARDKAVTDKAAAGIGEAATKVEGAKPATPATPFDIAKFAGIFAAIGLALGAIGTALAAIVSGFLSLAAWQMPLVILGIMVLISGPSVIMAWLKLRQRNLGPILDANGWAVNARVKINIPFGGALTSVAKLPPGAQRSLVDPYAQKSPARWLVPLLIVAAIIAGTAIWYYGYHKPAQEKQGAPPPPKVEAPAEQPPAK